MLKILERSIALQLLVFYGLFILPLLLGGVELYIFQRNALQHSAQQADLGLAQAIALEVESNVRAAAEEDIELSKMQAASQLDLQQLQAFFAIAKASHPDISLYMLCDPGGKMLLVYPSSQAIFDQNFHCQDYVQNALLSTTPVIVSGRINATKNTYVISIANRVIDAHNHPIGAMIIHLSLAQFTSRLMMVRQQLTNSSEVRMWIVDGTGKPLADTEGISPETNLLKILPGLKNALAGTSGNLIGSEQNSQWLYSYVPIVGTGWAVVVQRPKDVTFATLISFQNSLIIALVMLLFGASVFWFAMHGWVVAPLSKLAQAAALIKPDQTEKVTEGKLLARERRRIDEIGTLIAAFSHMEDEIHSLFRKTDEKSQARLHTLDAIMRSLDEGVLLEDPHGQVIYANHNLLLLLGIALQEIAPDSVDGTILSERLLSLIEDLDSYYGAIRRTEEGNGSQMIEFPVRGYYNQVGQFIAVRRHIRMRLFEVRDAAGQLIGRGKVFNDVTRHNEAEQVKKNLLAIVSHELRTPLTTIKGYATSLQATDIELDDALQEDFLQRIVVESDRMAELVTNLLEMSQLEAGTLKLYPSLHRLDLLLEQVIAMEMHPRIRITMPHELPVLYIDQRRFAVVLRNLLENAQRYAGSDAMIEISARYGHEQDEEGLYVSVADTGVGIPAHLTERIFDRFYQADEGRKRESSGVGLGLAICRGFIEAHGGRIWAENRTDGIQGAVFHLWFPPKLLHTSDGQANTFELDKAL